MFVAVLLLCACSNSCDTDTSDGDSTESDEVPVVPSAGCDAVFTRPTYGTTSDGAIKLPINVVTDTGERTVRPYVPPVYDHTSARPLILFLHGGGGNAQYQWEHSTLGTLSDRENVLLAFPDGLNASLNPTPHNLETWNGGGCCGPAADNTVDDVTFIDKTVTYLENTYCVDRNRIFVGGFSNGGVMSYRLACDLADRFAAFASLSGPNMTTVGWETDAPVGCTPSRRIALIHIHGTADENAPYDGGSGSCSNHQGTDGISFTAVEDYVTAWAEANGCGTRNDSTWPGGDVTTDDHANPCVIVGGTCPALTDTVLCTLPGGGHGYPQSTDSGRCDTDGPIIDWFNASDALWNFFSTHARPQG